ncbi:MAG: hypothetical protein V1770_01430 [bacterium]
MLTLFKTAAIQTKETKMLYPLLKGSRRLEVWKKEKGAWNKKTAPKERQDIKI